MQKSLNLEEKQENLFENEESETVYFDPKQYLVPGLSEKDIWQLKEVFESFCTKNPELTPMDIRSALHR